MDSRDRLQGDAGNEAARSPLTTGSGNGEAATDESLMQRASAGDLRAFELLYDRHARKAYNFFLRRLGSEERAKELTQDVFLALLRLGGRYRAQAPFVALFYGIARRLIGKEYGRMRRARGAQDASRVPGEATGWTEDGFAVREALARLPPRIREPLMLYIYERLSYEEIARVLRRPVGTVRSRIWRARRRLAELLGEEQR